MDTFCLNSLDDTRHLGRLLAKYIPASKIKALLLYGDLGSGKTTLTRELVTALPGGDRAEISSPSFTLCNHYPTSPSVLHCDLYRCQENLPDEILDALERRDVLSIIEWAEFLPPEDRPENRLDIFLKTCERGRLLTLATYGQQAGQLAVKLHDDWSCPA